MLLKKTYFFLKILTLDNFNLTLDVYKNQWNMNFSLKLTKNSFFNV